MHEFHNDGKLTFWVINRGHHLVELDDYGLSYREVSSEIGAIFSYDIHNEERILGRKEPILLEVDTFDIIKGLKNGVKKEYIIEYCFVNDIIHRHCELKIPKYLRKPIHLY